MRGNRLDRTARRSSHRSGRSACNWTRNASRTSARAIARCHPGQCTGPCRSNRQRPPALCPTTRFRHARSARRARRSTVSTQHSNERQRHQCRKRRRRTGQQGGERDQQRCKEDLGLCLVPVFEVLKLQTCNRARHHRDRFDIDEVATAMATCSKRLFERLIDDLDGTLQRLHLGRSDSNGWPATGERAFAQPQPADATSRAKSRYDRTWRPRCREVLRD